MPRRVLLMTTNRRKLAEYGRRLAAYGVAVEQRPKAGAAEVAAWLAGKEVLAVLQEESNLYDREGAEVVAPAHLEVVVNRTTLEVHARARGGEGGGEVRAATYVHEIEGHVDLTRRAADRADVFDWDDVFVPRTTLRSYDEMRRLGLKLSARDLVIDDFVREHLWYRRPVGLRWTPVEQARTIDFTVDPAAFLAGHPVWGRLPAAHPLRGVVGHVVADGLFFRAARNRREKNYWLPGLNAGVPFVPKRDDVHEATYMVHDLCHFAFPDLLFDGQGGRAQHHVYVVHRMMSEAFTLVLADMLFVDALRASGLDYDWTRRRIHPLFASLGLGDPTDLSQLRRVLWANARFCLAGDPSAYVALGADPAALAAFRDKYEQFFVADYRWTHQNFASMGERLGGRAPAWLALIAPLRARLPVATDTVGELTAALVEEGVDPGDLDALIEAVFARYLARLEALWGAPPPDDVLARRLTHGFTRWLCGQLALCVVFDLVPESAYYAARLRDAVAASPTLDLAHAQRLRGFFDQYVDLLHERRLISADDRAVFREVYPAFAPYFVEYDVELQAPLDRTARELVSRG